MSTSQDVLGRPNQWLDSPLSLQGGLQLRIEPSSSTQIHPDDFLRLKYILCRLTTGRENSKHIKSVVTW
jgi:hypothetical protein